MLTYAPTAQEYQAAFDKERVREYPAVDAFEERMGFALDRARLESAARVLACPIKKSGANWQHGRILYASARRLLYGKPSGCWTFLDIGTAKGFSALCAQWALMDHANGAITSGVHSVDVLDPLARVQRNTVAEVDGYKTLAETLAPWPESEWIRFYQSTGVEWLRNTTGQVDFAFVDGKHDGNIVMTEGMLLAERQQPGDIALFDDAQIPSVSRAVFSQTLRARYVLERLDLGFVARSYAIGVRL